MRQYYTNPGCRQEQLCHTQENAVRTSPDSATKPSGLPALGLGWLPANLVWNNSAQSSRLYSLNTPAHRLEHFIYGTQLFSALKLQVSNSLGTYATSHSHLLFPFSRDP